MNGRALVAAIAAAFGVAAAGCGGGGGGGASSGAGGETVQLTTQTLPGGTTGVEYVAQATAQVPHPPGVFFVAAGQLPTGVTLDSATGEIRGYPRQVGTFRFDLAVRDGVDRDLPPGRDATFAEDRKSFAVSVALGPPNILPQILPAAQYRAAYSYAIQIAGGTAPYVFQQVGGTLPAGVTLATNGVVGNFPTQGLPRTHDFDVRVTDAQGLVDHATLRLEVVVLPLVVLTAAVPDAARDFPYDVLLQLASPGGGGPYQWTQKPPGPGEVSLASVGMELTAAGRLRHATGLPGPSAIGTFAFSVQVVDEAGQVAEKPLTLRVNPGPTLSSLSPNRATASPPFVATGLNFQPGAVLIFKPGPQQVVTNPTFVSATELHLPSAPPTPQGGGAVTVRVQNPDGGFADLPNGFLFPFTNLLFGAKGFVASVLSSTGLACADLTGDGLADIVHCGSSGQPNYTQAGGVTSNAPGVHLLRNDGGLSFTQVVLDTASTYDVKLADVNLDGRLDVVALGATQVKTWINNPLGTFNPGPTSSLPPGFSYPSSLEIGFLNGDSIPDLVFGVAHFSNTNGQVHAMVGNGSGGFTTSASAPTQLSNTYGVIAEACLDLDGDGRQDVVAGTGWNNGNGINFRWSTTGPGGTFGAWNNSAASPWPWGNTLGLAAADFFGTGVPQVFCVHTQDPGDGNNRDHAIFWGSSLGGKVSLPIPSGLGKCVAAADVDYDGRADAAVSFHTGSVAIYRSTGGSMAMTSTLNSATGSPAVNNARTGRVAFGDLDGDGRLDVLATTSYWQTDYQPFVWGTAFALNLAGNGGSMGVVFWLNASN